MTPALVAWLNWVAIILAVCGAGVCLYAARMCTAPKKYFRYFAAIVLAYFAVVYLAAYYADWYVVKAGILTRIGVISLISLLIGWAMLDIGECKRHG